MDSGVTGSLRVYRHFGIDAIESGAWLGIVPALLAVWAIRRNWTCRDVRHWTAIGGVFLVWALGHHLLVFGHNTGMILPEALLRYIPIAANARVPGRAMVVVFLALALLAARALTAWRARSGHPTVVLACVLALVGADYLPAPFPLVEPGSPADLRDLARSPRDRRGLRAAPRYG